MYISARQKRKIVVFTMSLLVFLILGSFLIWKNWEVLKPENVVLSNVGENSVTVTWTTDTRSNGAVIVYSGSEKIGEFKDTRNKGRGYKHYVEVSNLQPKTSYEFEIVSSDGERYEFSTRDILSEKPIPNVVRGEADVAHMLAFLLVDDLSSNYPLSTYTSSNGEWSFDLSEITPASGKGLFDLRGDTPLKLLFYSTDGVKVIQGNRNALFARNGEFNGTVKLDGSENVFLHIPDFAKFKEDFVEVENIATDIEGEDISEDILGVEEMEQVDENEELEVVEEVEQVKESSIQRMESISDYGFR